MATAQERAAELRAELAQAEAEAKAERRAEREERRRQEREAQSQRLAEYREEQFDFTVGSEKFWMGVTETHDGAAEFQIHRWNEGGESVNLNQNELKSLAAYINGLISNV